MSKFIIGNKQISSLSGPVRVSVLKPNTDLKKQFEEEGGRLPYIILFGDEHFSKEDSCNNCSCGNDCCYSIDDPEFLKLIDGVASKNFPIDLFVEQIYEPRLGNPDIYDVSESLKRFDREGYLSKFIHDYRICYSKKDRRTKRYREECPTRDIRWHFIDTRTVEYGDSGEAKLYKGMIQFYSLLYFYFDKNKPENEDKSYKESMEVFQKYKEELIMVFDIIVNGPDFLNKYLDGDFLLTKQIRKQVLDELKNIDFWKVVLFERINIAFTDYMDTQRTNFNVDDYLTVMRFYKNVLFLIANNDISKDEFLIKRKELLESINNYNIFEENPSNLLTMISLTTSTAMMDAYTIARILKKPVDGIPAFASFLYAGNLHIKNVKDILIKYFMYTEIGESHTASHRCQNVKDIDFNLLKAKQDYK